MNYETLTNGTNLLVGAHPDDNGLCACNVIRSNPLDSIVMTVTNGAPPFAQDYPVPGLDGVNTPTQYAAMRRKEERLAMQILGVPEERSVFMDIPDQKSYENMGKIIDQIKQLITTYQPQRIFTHEFPQAHPDHEVACFCVHQAVRETGQDIMILEFPIYTILLGQERVNCELSGEGNGEIISYKFTDEELAFRNRLMKVYVSQPDLPERYTTSGEDFRVLHEPRDFSGNLPRSEYIKPWIREVTPEQVRGKLLTYPNIQIRNTTLADIDSILEIEKSVAGEHAATRQILTGRLNMFPEGFYVITEEDNIRGYIESCRWNRNSIEKSEERDNFPKLHVPDGRHLYIIYLAVDEHHRYKRFGSNLINKLKDYARENKLDKVHLVVGEGLVPFYSQLEFKVVKELPEYLPYSSGTLMEFLV